MGFVIKIFLDFKDKLVFIFFFFLLFIFLKSTLLSNLNNFINYKNIFLNNKQFIINILTK